MSVTIKICGLSTPDTLEAAIEAGADLVGFVFFPKSPRHLSIEAARNLAAQVRGRAGIAALTVDADDAVLQAVVAAVRPDWLQPHGRETPGRVRAVRARSGRAVMKAVGVSSRADLAAAAGYAEVADRILFDAKPPAGAVLPGGNGIAFDWTILAGLDLPVPFMLSGGLTPDNVRHALRLTGAPGVDVSSGVESGPGLKDPDRIRSFIRAVRDPGRVGT
jgi:phosphoribosylanthranilate isomerase